MDSCPALGSPTEKMEIYLHLRISVSFDDCPTAGLLPAQVSRQVVKYLNINMTDSGGFVKVSSDEEAKRMEEAARKSREKREQAKKEREAREAAEAAGKKSQERRGADPGSS
jgi:hypothetical protein